MDVAQVAGVSKSLVSLVLRGDASVSEARRKAVLKAVEKLNYKPNIAARQLASQSTKSIGVVITEYRNLSYVTVLAGLREIFDEAGYQVIVSDLHQTSTFGADPIDAFTSMRVDALVLIAEAAGLHTTGLGIPTVTVGYRETLAPGSDVVFSDDAVGTHEVIKHLHQLGHQAIAHITGTGGIAANRRRAYIAEMKTLGLSSAIFGTGQPTSEIGGYQAAKEMLAASGKFTALFAANDYMAAGAISALAEEGIRVPDDISVIGYDNAPIASEHLLKLTTVDDMGVEIGNAVANRILERLSQEVDSKTYRSQEILLQPQLVVRKSTSKPSTK